VIWFAVAMGLILACALLAPFLYGPGGTLAAGASIKSPERLAAIKNALVVRYVKDERAFQQGAISKREWTRRQHFLTNRYLDAARRLDFVQFETPAPAATAPAREGAT
jgi:hypothetical protein